MSVQILLQGKILSAEEFLLAGAPEEPLFAGRVRWVNLLSEVLPRALIAELGLSKMLLGSSGGEQFLVVLPQEVRPQAEEFLNAARHGIQKLSEQRVDLLWSITENLGDWTVVRKRLNEEFQRKQGTPLASTGFEFLTALAQPDSAYFEELATSLRDTNTVAWSPDSPARISITTGKHTWSIGSSPDSVPLARHTALTDDGRQTATAPILAGRAEGRPVWGVLRGDVDGFGLRMRRFHAIDA